MYQKTQFKITTITFTIQISGKASLKLQTKLCNKNEEQMKRSV